MGIDHANALGCGHTLKDYVIEEVLGDGGFGITYLARQPDLGKRFAIKEYLPRDVATRTGGGRVRPISRLDAADYSHGLDSFLREARIMARLCHPNIVQVQNFFRANGTAYLVMDYAEGENLDTILRRCGVLEEAELREILFPLLDGLSAVHKAGVLHRDIKPGNIFIRRDEVPLLLDFGAARPAGGRSRRLTAVATPGFAPYEQFDPALDEGPQTDIYALGATLYLAVTGRMPTVAAARLKSDPMVPAADAARGRCSARFLAAIDAALAVDPADRPADAETWRAMFGNAVPAPAATVPDRDRAAPPPIEIGTPVADTLMIGEPATTRRPSRARGRRRTRRAMVAAALIVAPLVLGAGGWSVTTYLREQRADEAARQTSLDARRAAEIRARHEAARRAAEATKRQAELDAKRRADLEARRKAEVEAERKAEAEAERKAAEDAERKAREDAERQRDQAYRDGYRQFHRARNYGQALAAFRKAAALGHTRAQNYLGVMYSKGLGAPRDYRAALEWYRKAASAGFAAAQHNLGVLYSSGLGVPRDYAKAVAWYRKAAVGQGYARAQLNLGLLYAKGLGVPKDNVRAHMWFSLAAARGVANAAWNAKFLERRMTPAETRLARKLAARRLGRK